MFPAKTGKKGAYADVKAKVFTGNYHGKAKPAKAPIKQQEVVEEEKKVSEEYRPLFTYVKTKTESEESEEGEDECEKYGLTFEEWLYRKAHGLPLYKF